MDGVVEGGVALDGVVEGGVVEGAVVEGGVVGGAVIQGIGVSSGSAYAPVVQVGAAVRPPADEAVLPPEEAARVIREALEAVAVEIERRAALASDNAAEILGATAMLVRPLSRGMPPPESSFHVTPPSIDLYTAVPVGPLC